MFGTSILVYFVPVYWYILYHLYWYNLYQYTGIFNASILVCQAVKNPDFLAYFYAHCGRKYKERLGIDTNTKRSLHSFRPEWYGLCQGPQGGGEPLSPAVAWLLVLVEPIHN